MTILGPDGNPLRTAGHEMRRYRDGTLQLTSPTESYRADPQQLLMEMARAERDGMNHRQLIAHFGLMGQARSPHVLNRALKVGRQLLEQAIARGLEPIERPMKVMDEVQPDPADDIEIEYDEERAAWRPR
jgi:hypothetical protein